MPYGMISRVCRGSDVTSHKLPRTAERTEIEPKIVWTEPRPLTTLIELNHEWDRTGSHKDPPSHKCLRCLEPNETQEHLLQCRHIGAHKKHYDLILPMMRKICQNKLCQVQEVFTTCIRSWLESPETSIPDVSSVHESHPDLLQKTISDQEHIGWHLAMRGYLSKYWGLAVAAN
jgi:hypothetical protein